MPSTRRKLREPTDHPAPAAPARSPKVVALASKRRRLTEAEAVVRSFAAAVSAELRAKHAAGRPYSTMNAAGEVVFVHPDGSVRVGRSADSALAH